MCWTPRRGNQERTRTFLLKVLLFTGCLWFLFDPGGLREGRVSLSPAPATAQESKPVKGIHVDHVDRDATDRVAWIKIRVLSDTPPAETWNVIQNIQAWDQFMDLYSHVAVLRADGPMEMYEFTVSPPWPMSEAKTYVRVMKRPKDQTLDYWVDQGFMQGTYGKISVGKANGGSWILFENYGSPNHRFPDWVVKIGVYLVTPSVLKDIRNRVLKQMSEPSTGFPR